MSARKRKLSLRDKLLAEADKVRGDSSLAQLLLAAERELRAYELGRTQGGLVTKQADGARVRAEARLLAAEASLAERERDLAEARARIDELETMQVSYKGDVLRLRQGISKMLRDRIATLERELNAVRGLSEARGRELADARAEVATLEERRSHVEANMTETLRRHLERAEAAEARLAERERELAEARERIKALTYERDTHADESDLADALTAPVEPKEEA
jgi:chromosome segregation ATPase